MADLIIVSFPVAQSAPQDGPAISRSVTLSTPLPCARKSLALLFGQTRPATVAVMPVALHEQPHFSRLL